VWLCSLHHRPDNYLKGIIYRSGLICQYICIPNIQKLVHIVMFVVFNSALKGVDGTPQPKLKAAGPTWIVVKVSNLNNNFNTIYLMFVFCETLELFEYLNFIVFSVINKKETLSVVITSCTGCQL